MMIDGRNSNMALCPTQPIPRRHRGGDPVADRCPISASTHARVVSRCCLYLSQHRGFVIRCQPHTKIFGVGVWWACVNHRPPVDRFVCTSYVKFGRERRCSRSTLATYRWKVETDRRNNEDVAGHRRTNGVAKGYHKLFLKLAPIPI